MKRVWLGLLITALLMGSGTGFALTSSNEPMEPLDSRVSKFIEGNEDIPGDVKYLSNGNVAVQGFQYTPRDVGIRDQETQGLNAIPMVVGEVDRDGNVVDDHFMFFDAPRSTFEQDLAISNFIVEDIDGNLYAAVSGGVVEIAYDFSTSAVTNFSEFWELEMWGDVKSQGRTMINTLSGFEGKDEFLGGEVLGFTYAEGQSPTELPKYDSIGAEMLEVMTGLDYEYGRLMSADFGDTENELYLLYGTVAEESSEWAIVEMSVEWSDRSQRRDFETSPEPEIWTVENVIKLDENFNQNFAMGLVYDGSGFQISTIAKGMFTTIYRVNKNGEVEDSVKLPGLSFYFDARGNEAIASVMVFTGSDMVMDSTYYKIEWGTSATGSPSKLIRERSMGGKTTAVFRDGGYGLLQKNEDEFGLIDYLAPLRTKENDIRLRMPLSDVVTRLGESARNLEIHFGEDRISIPMTALAVQDLLAQMPCETDATIEIHLVRGSDGTVSVTADLFVIEQVDGMTRLVHRRAIDLP